HEDPVGGGVDSRARPAGGGSRHPGRCEGKRLREAGRAAASSARSRAAESHARGGLPRRGAGFLDLARADASLRNAATLWIADNVDLYEGDVHLALPRVAQARVSLESDKSFASYEQALAHVTGPRLPNNMELYWEQGLLDVLFDYPIDSDRSDFSIRPRLERLGLRTTVV